MKALSDTQSDLQLKLKRIYDFLEEHHFDSLLLQRKDNFAWLTSGGFNGIPYNSITGECGLLITKEHVFLLADTIEKPRITAEEMTGLSYELLIIHGTSRLKKRSRRVLLFIVLPLIRD